MGHAKIETTMIYTHHTPKIAAAAAAEMSHAVAEAMGARTCRET
jgi:hypothetical protein